MLDLSCPDWADRLRAGRSLIAAPPIDADEAKRAVRIYDMLHLPDVPETPALAEAGGDWFREIIGALFGSRDRGTGERLIREVLGLVPKKNSKTTNGAALMLTALLMNERPRAEFIMTGPTQEVSDLAFAQARGMIECDPEGFLQKRMHVQTNFKTITDRRTRARLKIKTFDASVVTGPKPAGVLIDELHEIAKIKDAANIIGQLRGGMVSQPEAFLVFITTQSDRPPTGAFKAELQKARAIRDGILKGVPMLPVLYEFPREMQQGGENAPWRDPANWWMVTPNRGKSITVERLQQDFIGAQSMGPAEVIRWSSQHLNVEIGLALNNDRWPGAEFWARQAAPALSLEGVLARSECVVVGVDGGGLDDLFGLVVLGRCRETKHWLAWAHAWCHEGVLERRQTIAATLRDFEKAGDLTIVGDELADVSDIIEIIAGISDRGLLASVAVDPAGLGEFVDELAKIGITQEAGTLKGAPQGYAMMNAIKTAERKLANGTLWHSGCGLMAWAVGNLKIEPTATAIRATKQNAGDAKIDPVMALFDAVTVMSLNPEAAGAIAMAEEVIF